MELRKNPVCGCAKCIEYLQSKGITDKYAKINKNSKRGKNIMGWKGMDTRKVFESIKKLWSTLVAYIQK